MAAGTAAQPRPWRDAAFCVTRSIVSSPARSRCTSGSRDPCAFRATVLPFVEQRAGGAHLHALAAAGAGVGRSPGLAEIGDDQRVPAPRRRRPRCARPPLRRRRARSACTGCSGCGRWPKRSWLVSTGKRRELVAETHVIDAQRRGQVLQFAGAVRHADRADVIALGQQQLDDQLALATAAVGVSVRTTMPSSTGVRQEACSFFWPSTSTMQSRHAPTSLMPADVAEPRDVNAVFPGHGENGVSARARSPSCRRSRGF